MNNSIIKKIKQFNIKINWKERIAIDLTEKEKALIKLFKSLNMSEELIIATLLAAQTEEQVDKLIDYILNNQKTITSEKILHKALQIGQE